MSFKWMTLNQVLKYEPLIISENVSEVARSNNGFLNEYKKYKSTAFMKKKQVPNENITWERKRENFIKRTLPSYEKKPTTRRYLSLITWAFKPN